MLTVLEGRCFCSPVLPVSSNTVFVYFNSPVHPFKNGTGLLTQRLRLHHWGTRRTCEFLCSEHQAPHPEAETPQLAEDAALCFARYHWPYYGSLQHSERHAALQRQQQLMMTMVLHPWCCHALVALAEAAPGDQAEQDVEANMGVEVRQSSLLSF